MNWWFCLSLCVSLGTRSLSLALSVDKISMICYKLLILELVKSITFTLCSILTEF